MILQQVIYIVSRVLQCVYQFCGQGEEDEDKDKDEDEDLGEARVELVHKQGVAVLVATKIRFLMWPNPLKRRMSTLFK